jgi:dinuclear metal center YbgI/SA1388 family protein
MKLIDIISIIETVAPLAYQESYDNSGLAVGEPDMEITGALLCVDVTLPVVEEALQQGVNLIISHHPVIFGSIRQLTGKTSTERIVMMALRHHIAIYSSHTSMDNVDTGVNLKICHKLGLTNLNILLPQKNVLKKLVTFVPQRHAEDVRNALFLAGAGHIGQYDSCSFNLEGKGSFRALEGSQPFVGETGHLHIEDEIRIEMIFPAPAKSRIVHALLKAHPYEEVAYDIYALENEYAQAGSGMIGNLEQALDEESFLQQVKEIFQCKVIRHSKLFKKLVRRVAVCGGSGSSLIQHAISAGADLFLTGEVKYHQFFDAEEKIIIADIGHFESEQFTVEIFYDILLKKIPNFAIHFSRMNTSPIYYL